MQISDSHNPQDPPNRRFFPVQVPDIASPGLQRRCKSTAFSDTSLIALTVAGSGVILRTHSTILLLLAETSNRSCQSSTVGVAR
jgi:hypothetical protein